MAMCKWDEDSGRIVFGWEVIEEAFVFAPFVLRPRSKQQLQVIVGMLWLWVYSEDDYPNEEERKEKLSQFTPLFVLNSDLLNHSEKAMRWDNKHEEAFCRIDNAGSWRSCYELV